MPSAAVERCANACAGKAWRLAYALLRDADDAYDAVQQAFLVAAGKPDQVPTDDPWPWFSVVVAHEVRNLRRKRRPLTNRIGPRGDGTPDGGTAEGGDMELADARGPEPGARAEGNDDAARVWREIDGLPGPEREALLLVHLAGMTHAGAADALGIPRQTVTERARRGLETLAARVRRDAGEAARLVALLPVAAPRGGLASATAAWTKAATTTVASTTVGTVAAVAAGATLMGTKALWVGGLVVGAGLAFLGGAATDGFGLFEAPARTSASATAPDVRRADAAARNHTSSPPGLTGAGSGGDTLDTLRAENQRLTERLAQVERELEARRADGEPAAADSAPVFTFGEMGSLPAVREADWEDLSEASKLVTDSVVEIFRTKERGEEVPKELYMRLQENTERVRRYEYRTIDKMPTAAKHNGELTHPISLSNLIAGVLAKEGAPLSPAQIAEVERLGVAFDEEFVRLRGGWTQDKPRARRLLEEYRLKGKFTEGLWNVLTPEQRVHWVDPSLRGIAGLDLYDPTLMIVHTTPVVVGADAAEIRPKLLTILRTKLRLAAEAPAAHLEAHVDTFLAQTLRGAQPVPKSRAKNYTYAEGLAAGEATVVLVESLLRDLELPDGVRQALADDFAWYLPRLVV